MDKLQIQTAAEREQWRQLQDRFDFPEVFKDDPSIPGVTEIYYSKFHLLVKVLFGLFFVAIGVFLEYLALKHRGNLSMKIFAAVIAVSPIYLIFIAVKRMFKKQPELVLDNQGLQIASIKFLNWDLIFNERVTKTQQGRRGVKYTLTFQHPGGIEHIDISDFDVSKGRLERLIRVYKRRYAAGIN